VSVGALEATVALPQGPLDEGSLILAARADAVRMGAADLPGAVGARIAFASNRGASALYELATDDGQVLQAAEERRGGALRAPSTRVGVTLAGASCSIVRA